MTRTSSPSVRHSSQSRPFPCTRIHRAHHGGRAMLREGPPMSNAIPSYLEIVDFIAAGTTPQAVVDYRPAAEAQQRVAELIAREKECSLSAEEKAELDHVMDLEHILRMAKARARQILTSGSWRRRRRPPARRRSG